jgi:hypothetical protein
MRVTTEKRASPFAPSRRPGAASVRDDVTLNVGGGDAFAEDQRQRVRSVLNIAGNDHHVAFSYD